MSEQNKYKDKIITIPNMLSVFRILLIPFFIWLYVVEKNYLWALIVLVISGFTDILDGFIARQFNMTSDFGKMIDPVADKLTQTAVLFSLIFRFRLMLIPFSLLIVKELILGIMTFLIIKQTGVVKGAMWHGKVTTALLYAMMAAHVFWYNMPMVASNILIFVTVGVMSFSLVLYFIQHLKILLQIKEEELIEQ